MYSNPWTHAERLPTQRLTKSLAEIIEVTPIAGGLPSLDSNLFTLEPTIMHTLS